MKMQFLFGLIAFTFAQTPDRTFRLLKDDRKNIDFVPYTPEQRVQVAKNIDAMMKIYYHREQKIEVYGKEYGKEYDPLPRVAKILERSASMTDSEFHYAFSEVFHSMRDFHLNYNMPAPHACFAAVQPVSFSLVEENLSGQRKVKVVVKSFSTQPEVLALIGSALSRINIGDELITIDGITFDQYVEKEKFLVGGANESGALRAALGQISAVGGRYSPMPKKDDVTFQLKAYKSGNVYTVTVPWIARRRTKCYDDARAFIDGGMVSESFAGYSPTGKGISNSNLELETFKETFRNNQVQFELKDTADPIIKWGIYKPESKNLGVLFIDGFTPADGDDAKVTRLIHSLLVNQLKNTNALILDLRENGGGSGLMADLIPQLFVTATNATVSRAVNHPFNRALFTSLSDTAFLQAFSQTRESDKYTPWVPGTSQAEFRRYGMAYTKPVGVFTSGSCYSACDYFSANMQDTGAALIFGEDQFSGAGYFYLTIVGQM
jgi:hypothetical protein